ncbi:MAG: hypothetical protein JXQ80_03395 [Bacteroidales bacterium]|nr:hypothetical protein [Bacteroidales bacterium]
MKPTFTLLLAFVLSGLHSSAQKPILIYDGSVELGGNHYPGIHVAIPEVPFEAVQKNWIKTMESGTKSKAVYDKGNWTLFGANISSVSPTPVNIYSRIENQDSLVRLLVAMELRKDDFVQKGSHEAELASVKEYLKQFAKGQYLDLVKAQLKAEEKKLKEVERNFRSYGKQQSRLERTIKSAEKTLNAEQEALVTSNTELNSVTVELASQTMQFNELAEGPAREERAKYLKSLEKRKKQITRAISKSESKISKSENAIRDANAQLPKKENLQGEAKDDIADQQAVVQQYRDKLAKIEQY